MSTFVSNTGLKPVIKVWCLPKLSEEELQQLFVQIRDTLKVVEGSGVKDDESLLVLMPPDSMSFGLGTEILVEATIPLVGNTNLNGGDLLENAVAGALLNFFSDRFQVASVQVAAHVYFAKSHSRS